MVVSTLYLKIPPGTPRSGEHMCGDTWEGKTFILSYSENTDPMNGQLKLN